MARLPSSLCRGRVAAAHVMVDKLSLVQRALSGLLRTQGSQRGESSNGHAEASRASLAMPLSSGPRTVDLEQQVRQRVAQVGRDDPQRRRRALRLIVEATLLKEFGERLEADPAFHTLVDDVVQMIDDAPGLRRSVDEIMAKL